MISNDAGESLLRLMEKEDSLATYKESMDWLPEVLHLQPSLQQPGLKHFLQEPNMHSLQTIFVVAALTAVALAQADTPTIEFDCTDTPELCANMCWGAYCTDNGDGAIGVTLTYDAPDADTTNARYKAACQTPSNRCSGEPTYNSCDEYPFKITSDADLDDAVSRCVTTNAQQIQGGKISALIKTLTNPPEEFIVLFGNPGDAQYCEYPPTCDNSDGLEWQNGGPAPNPSNPPSRKRYYYITERGTEVLSPVELEVGHRITSFQVNQTRVNENVKRLGKRDHDSEYHTVDDWVALKVIKE